MCAFVLQKQLILWAIAFWSQKIQYARVRAGSLPSLPEHSYYRHLGLVSCYYVFLVFTLEKKLGEPGWVSPVWRRQVPPPHLTSSGRRRAHALPRPSSAAHWWLRPLGSTRCWGALGAASPVPVAPAACPARLAAGSGWQLISSWFTCGTPQKTPAWCFSAAVELGFASWSALKSLSGLSAAVPVNCWFVCFCRLVGTVSSCHFAHWMILI